MAFCTTRRFHASLLLWLTGAVALAFSLPTLAADQHKQNVGFRVIQVPDGPKTAIWYPTPAAESPHGYARGAHGFVALNAPPGDGPYPLVLFSHGFEGCGIQSVFFTEQLARAGYIVAAPDHADAGCHSDGHGLFHMHRPEKLFSQPKKWDDSTYRDRRDDMEALLDWMLASREFAGHIDAGRIAVAGHSLGGYVALGLAGAWPGWKEPRIKAVLVFSPYLKPYLVKDRLRNVHVPVMYQGAEWDAFITPSVRDHAYGDTNPPRYFLELRRGNHFEWTNAVCLGQASVTTCVRDNASARLITQYGMAFLDTYLRNKPDGLERLNGDALVIYRHDR